MGKKTSKTFDDPPERIEKLDVNEDLTGRDRMAWNVFTSWGGHLVFVVTGFVMPRLVDHQLGQFSLGIWDFAWALVNYLSISGLGVGSSVNRYVAKYRASNDLDGLRTAVSSVWCIQIGIALFILMMTAALVWALPLFFSERLGSEVNVTRWVVGFLGSSLAMEMAADTSRGMMTGYHRWDLHNAINASSHMVAVVGMIIVLLLGGDLRGLAIVHFSIVTITEITRVVLARRVCHESRIGFAYVKWSQLKKMLFFGTKTIVLGLPLIIMSQTITILVTSFLGPAALAVFSRPMALIRHLNTFMSKFVFVLTPTAGSLQGSGQIDELRRLFIESTRYGVALTLPAVLFLSIYGDTILQIWMGPRYAHGLLLATLAIGGFLPISQRSINTIMIGMNLHGKIALMSLVLNLIFFGLGIFIVNGAGWSLQRAALIFILPAGIVNGIIMPIYTCYRVGVPISKYVMRALFYPSLCALPFGICLIAGRLLLPNNALSAFLWGGTVGVLLMGAIYWRYILPVRLRSKLLGTLSSVLLKSKSLLFNSQ